MTINENTLNFWPFTKLELGLQLGHIGLKSTSSFIGRVTGTFSTLSYIYINYSSILHYIRHV